MKKLMLVLVLVSVMCGCQKAYVPVAPVEGVELTGLSLSVDARHTNGTTSSPVYYDLSVSGTEAIVFSITPAVVATEAVLVVSNRPPEEYPAGVSTDMEIPIVNGTPEVSIDTFKNTLGTPDSMGYYYITVRVEGSDGNYGHATSYRIFVK